MRAMTVFLLLLGFAAWALPVLAEPTQVVVHVRAKGSKFIGSSMGGAQVTIRDAQEGTVLAQGVTSGGTGDTQRIMRTRLRSVEPLSTEGAASFEVTLDIERPRLIEVEAAGPMTQLQAANRASATQWLLPGKDIRGGDAFLLEVPGMLVEIEAPSPGAAVSGSDGVRVEAQVAMGCGCPLTPEGLWDPGRMEIRGLVNDGEAFDLEYAGRPSRFAGSFQPSGSGTYDLTVYVFDPSNGNTGLDRVVFTVR